MNDPRLAGRWWSTDPITKPWESPYAGYGNNPVSFIDPMGLYDTPAGAPENPQHNQEFTDENGNLYTYIETNYNKVGVIGNWIPTAQIEAEGPTWLQRTGDFLAGSGFGALDWIGSKFVAPINFLMNWNEPSYRQGLENDFNGAVTTARAVGGDQSAQVQVATGVKKAAKNWWNASDFDRGKPFGGVAMDIAVPWGISKFGRAGSFASVSTEIPSVVYHSTSRPGVASNILEGIDSKFFNPNSRMGRGFYLSDSPETTIAELAHHGATRVNTIEFTLSSQSNIFDATGKIMNVGVKYAPKPLSNVVKILGFDGLKYNSLRNPSGVNTVLFNNFGLLSNGRIYF